MSTIVWNIRAINNLQVSDASNGAATNRVYFTITYQV